MEYVEGCDLGRLMAARARQGDAHPAVGRRVDHRRGGQGAALRAREEGRGRAAARDRPPRREPAEHPALVRGGGEDRRLRHRERAPLRRGAGRPQGQVRVHVARAGARRERRPPQRPLRARRHPLGDPRRASDPRRARGRGAARHRALGHRRAADDVREGRPARARGDRAARARRRRATSASRPGASSRRRWARAIVKQGELIDASTLEATIAQLVAAGRARRRERAAAVAGRRSRGMRVGRRTHAGRRAARAQPAESRASAQLRGRGGRPGRRRGALRRRPRPRCRGARRRPRGRARCGTSPW